MKLAIFDFDGTLFPLDTIPFLMRQWGVQKYPRHRLVTLYVSLAGLFVRYKLGLHGRMSREQIKMTAMAAVQPHIQGDDP